MKPDQVVAELVAMRNKVLREMPHVGCRPVFIEGDTEAFIKCNCYKEPVLAALREAEMYVRASSGMEPF